MNLYRRPPEIPNGAVTNHQWTIFGSGIARTFRWIIVALAMPLVATAAESHSVTKATEGYTFTRHDIPNGESIKLLEFGGSEIALAIRAAEMTYVLVDVADFTRLVPISRPIFSGARTSEIIMVPIRSSHRIEKKNGTPFPGHSSDMYLLYEDRRTRIRVYFLDAIPPINHRSIVIAVPSQFPLPPENIEDEPPAESNQEPSAESTQEPPVGFVSRELHAWYLKLQRSRQALDTADAAAVAKFNKQAAAYHKALKQAREFRNAK